jgi:Ninjurin
MSAFQLIDDWVQASAEARQNMMRNPNAGTIAAVVVCSSREIQVVTRLGYSAVDDAVVGVVEAEIDVAVSISVNQVIRNVQLVLVGAPLVHLPTVPVGNDSVGWLPVAYPLIKGHRIRNGDIFDDGVRNSLRNYHPTVGRWVDMMFNEFRNNAIANLVPPPPLPAPLKRAPTWRVPVLPVTETDPLISLTPDIDVKALAPSRTNLVVPTKVDTFDPNNYANYKSVVQGLLNGSVFSVNIGILINLYGKYNKGDEITFFTPLVTFLILSVWTEFFNFLFALILLFFYDIKKAEHRWMSQAITFAALLLSFFSLFFNVVVSNFVSQSGVTLSNSTSPIVENSTMANITGS